MQSREIIPWLRGFFLFKFLGVFLMAVDFLDEWSMVEKIEGSKRVLLLEPSYRRKYMPLGLAKIASLVKRKGNKVIFQRDHALCDEDLICVTSLFTYDAKRVLGVIRNIKRSFSKNVPMIIGGIYASLMPDDIRRRFSDVSVFRNYSRVLDLCPPDYTIDWRVEGLWDSFSYVFTTRGCPNKCPYCAVWRLEDAWINPSWKQHISRDRPNVLLSDNNLSSHPEEHVEDVLTFLADEKKGVLFDNGFDCKYINRSVAGLLGRLKFVRRGMRLSFDRIEEDGVFQSTVERLKSAGVSERSVMVYVLFNFIDTPKEADYRMRECARLGLRPYPNRYTPLNVRSRKDVFIGNHWTKDLLTVFRFFWLMADYDKMTFEEWVKKQDKFPPLKRSDWDKWYGR